MPNACIIIAQQVRGEKSWKIYITIYWVSNFLYFE